MIFLNTKTADVQGRLVLRNYQVTGDYENTARISRSKTLDGSAVISHYGVSVCDRDLSIDCRMTEDEASRAKTFFENATPLRISFWEGAFSGYIYRLRIGRNGAAQFLFYFLEKLA